MPVESGKLYVYSLEEAMNMPNSPQPYLIEHLIYKKGKTVIVGKPKFGKSFFCIRSSACIAGGKPFLGLRTTRAKTLYLEFDRRYLTNAIHDIVDEEILEAGRENWYVCKVGLPLALNRDADRDQLSAMISKIMPDLIILDHKSACFAGKENDDEPNRKWVQNCDFLADINGSALLVIAQSPKSWRGEIQDLPFGSRILTAWADTIISIVKSNDTYRKLEVVSNYGGIPPIVYNKHFQLVSERDEEYTKKDLAKDSLREVWSTCKYPNIKKVVEQVAKDIGASVQTVWDAYRIVKVEKRQQKNNQLELDGEKDVSESTQSK